jgi:hypothetical protein
MRKKGLSMIITAVLLIALGLLSAVIIFNATNKMVSRQGEGIERDLLKYSANIESFESVGELGTAGVGGDGALISTTKIILKRMDDEGDILGLKFVFTDNQSNSYSYESNKPLNDAGIYEQYSIDVGDVDRLNDFDGIEKVSVSFIYAKDKTSKVLDEEFFKE